MNLQNQRFRKKPYISYKDLTLDHNPFDYALLSVLEK